MLVAVRIPGPDNSGRSGADTQRIDLGGSRALRHPSVTLRRRRDESQQLATAWCRGDLASWHPEGRRNDQRWPALAVRPPPVQRRVLAEHAAAASTAAVAGCSRPEIDAPGGASSRCPSAEAAGRGRTSLPTPVTVRRRMLSVASRPLPDESPHHPRGAARTRGEAHEEPSPAY